MKRLTLAAVTATLVSLSAAGQTPAQTQTVTGPVATYWVTAETSSGLPGMGGGGFNPMAMMSGGGAGGQKSLYLQLQSDRTAAGPTAEHLPPSVLGMGASLPLVSRSRAAAANGGDPRREPTRNEALDGRMPRILIYFGCGEATRPGQPIVIDMRNSQGAQQMAALTANLRLSAVTPPAPGANRTYGEWPNERERRQIPTNGSLVGDHLVRGNYTPDIRFSLGANQDFLAPLVLTGVDQPGSGRLGWNAVPNAQGYYAYTMGTNEAGDMVFWSSSEMGVGFGGIPDHLPQADLERLVRQKVIMAPTTTRCAIPNAAIQAAPEAMLRMIAYGTEANFTYPPRPADRTKPWNIEHVVKVRYNSTASTMLGMNMRDLAEDDADEADPANRPSARTPGNAAGAAARAVLGGFLRR